MRTIQSITVALLILASTTLSMALPKKNDNPYEQIRKQIKREIKVPDFLTSEATFESATVSFKVSDKGKIEIQDVLANNDKLKNYIREELQDLTINHMFEEINQTVYSIELIFKVH